MIPLLRFGSSQELPPKKKLNQIALTANALAQRGAPNMRLDTSIQDFFQAANVTTTGNVPADKLTETGTRLFDEINRANIRLKSGEPPENEALIEAIQSFLDAGGNIHKTKIDNNSLLHMTVGNGCPKSTELLLSHGADAYMEDGAGKTSWDVIDEQEGVIQQLQTPKGQPHRIGLEATRKALEANDKALQQLKLAVITPNKVSAEKPDEEAAVTKAVHQLVEGTGFSVNATLPPSVYQPGGSLVHLLTRYAWSDGIQYLLQKEADMEKEDNQGCNPNKVLKAQQKAYPGSSAFSKVQSLFRPYLPLTNKKYAEAVKKLNEHLPANRESLTEEPKDSVSWIKAVVEEAGEDILQQTKLPGLNRSESLFELVAIAGWPKATAYLLNCDVDPRMKGSHDKTISGLLDQQAHRHPENQALKDTQKVLSRAVQKAAALIKAKQLATEAIQRAEKGEKGETEALASSIESYAKLCNGFDSMVMEDKTFLHLSAKYGWPKTAAKLLAMGLDPRGTTDDEDEIDSFQLIENSLAAIGDDPKKAQQKEDLLSVRSVLFQKKALWDATTALEEAMDKAHDQRDEHSKYGDTPKSEKAVLDFINLGGDPNQLNHFFPVKGSVLHALALYGMKNSIAPVIKAGGNPTQLDPDGDTPLEIVQAEQRFLRPKIQQDTNYKTRILLQRELKKLVETESVLKEAQRDLESRTKAKQGLPKSGNIPLSESSSTPTTATNRSTPKGNGNKNTPRVKPQTPGQNAKKSKQPPPKKTMPAPAPPPVYDPEAAKRQSDEALEKKRAKEAEKAAKKKKQQELEEGNRKAKQDRLDEKKQMAKMQDEIARLDAQLAQAKADTTRLEAEIPQLQTAVDQKTAPLQKLQQAHTTLESTLEKKQIELRRLEQARLEKQQKAASEKARIEAKIQDLEAQRDRQNTEMQNIHRKMGPAQARLTSLEFQNSELENIRAQYEIATANMEQDYAAAQYHLKALRIRKEFQPEGGGWLKVSGENTGIWVPTLPLPTQENPFRIDLGSHKPPNTK